MCTLQLQLVLLLMLSFSACGGGVTPTTSEPPLLTSAQVLQPGPFAMGVTTMTFEDTSRPTMPNGIFPGAPTRVLVTERKAVRLIFLRRVDNVQIVYPQDGEQPQVFSVDAQSVVAVRQSLLKQYLR